MTQHADCAPSSAERIELCPGSMQMERRYPVDDDEDTRNGEAVHWAGHYIVAEMDGQITDLLGPPTVGAVAPNGVVLNVEMLRTAHLWADTITDSGRVGHIEETITTPVLHPSNWGTPDHWDYFPEQLLLVVDDLKNGHRHVEVKRNRQLANYAALILNILGLFHRDDIRIRFRIVQPNSYHRDGDVREWWTTSGELREIWRIQAAAFAAACGPSPRVTPHIDACRDCKARFDCEGALTVTSIAVDISKQSEPLNMSPAALSREYKLLLEAEGFIKARRKGIEDRVMHVVRRVGTVPHFALERKSGRVVWLDDAVANGIIDVCKAFGVDAGRTEVGLTPLQAIQAGVPAEIVKQFSRTNSGALELVEDDGSKAAAIFNPKE